MENIKAYESDFDIDYKLDRVDAKLFIEENLIPFLDTLYLKDESEFSLVMTKRNSFYKYIDAFSSYCGWESKIFRFLEKKGYRIKYVRTYVFLNFLLKDTKRVSKLVYPFEPIRSEILCAEIPVAN